MLLWSTIKKNGKSCRQVDQMHEKYGICDLNLILVFASSFRDDLTRAYRFVSHADVDV